MYEQPDTVVQQLITDMDMKHAKYKHPVIMMTRETGSNIVQVIMHSKYVIIIMIVRASLYDIS